VLQVSNLWRFFGESPAVAGLEMNVESGSAYGFIGPNGAGKSTTLRLLATLDRPTAGQILVDGEDAFDRLERVRPKLGFMPDPFELYDDLTVEEHLEFFAQAYELPRSKRASRVAAALELAKVGERRAQRCGQLSKGWKQRVLLAKTLVHDPKLLLLDEPASGLDPAARIEFRAIVRELRALGKTIIVSSHILTELADFCDSVGIIERGRMLVSGKIDEILQKLDPTTRLEIEVLSDLGVARKVLEQRPDIVKVEAGEAPGTLVARGKLGPDAASVRAEIVGSLVAAGARVASFTAKKEGLEDLFLRVNSENRARPSAKGRRGSPRQPSEPAPVEPPGRRALLDALGDPRDRARPIAPPPAGPPTGPGSAS
jgi:ABC-2 type transport system ATP-binding protein